jgi:hypothetical protein
MSNKNQIVIWLLIAKINNFRLYKPQPSELFYTLRQTTVVTAYACVHVPKDTELHKSALI